MFGLLAHGLLDIDKKAGRCVMTMCEQGEGHWMGHTDNIIPSMRRAITVLHAQENLVYDMPIGLSNCTTFGCLLNASESVCATRSCRCADGEFIWSGGCGVAIHHRHVSHCYMCTLEPFPEFLRLSSLLISNDRRRLALRPAIRSGDTGTQK